MRAEASRDDWHEDLLSQAQRARAMGPALCACEGQYHSLWSSLRVADINNGLKREEPLLASLIAPLIRNDARVMIGGAADPGVLCVIGRIYAAARPKITVIDRCRAPLESIREFAAARNLDCQILQLDLLDLNDGEQWDQIVLHYTSDFVESDLRHRFFRTIAQSLVPGGTVVCAAMTGLTFEGDKSQEFGRAYLSYCLRAFAKSPLADMASTPEFTDALRNHADAWGRRRANLQTGEELRNCLTAAGLNILTERTTPRRKRIVKGGAIFDSSSIIIAGH